MKILSVSKWAFHDTYEVVDTSGGTHYYQRHFNLFSVGHTWNYLAPDKGEQWDNDFPEDNVPQCVLDHLARSLSPL